MTLIIQPLKTEQIADAKAVITEGCLEFYNRAPANFGDMEALAIHYTPPSGIFLVFMDGERVVGTGAIRRIDDQVCELKRMWFRPAYRGKGHGTRMAEALLAFARSTGYSRVRLDTDPVLKAANRLYQSLGFIETRRTAHGPSIIYMEKRV